MRLVPPDSGVKSFTVDEGREYRRHRDGTFHVPDSVGKAILRGGEFGRAGVSMRGARGYWCTACRFTSVFRKCGRCGAENLPENDQ